MDDEAAQMERAIALNPSDYILITLCIVACYLLVRRAFQARRSVDVDEMKVK